MCATRFNRRILVWLREHLLWLSYWCVQQKKDHKADGDHNLSDAMVVPKDWCSHTFHAVSMEQLQHTKKPHVKLAVGTHAGTRVLIVYQRAFQTSNASSVPRKPPMWR